MSRRPFRRVTFQLKLLRQMRISLQKQFVFILTNHQKMVNFLFVLNQRISRQFSKKAHVRQKITRDQLVFSLFFQRYLKGYLVDNFQSSLIIYYLNFNIACYGTQHCLLMILEIWKRVTDNNKAFSALLTDLSKAFDCLSHDLLIAKLHAFGLDIDSPNILQDYLSNRKQRTKRDSFYSSQEAILSGVLQGSILGPLLFNIFMCNMFLII